jgi:hypothetical protein
MLLWPHIDTSVAREGGAAMSQSGFTWSRRLATVSAVVAMLAFAQVSSAQTGAPQTRQPAINPATGEPPGAPTGCCCYPKADSAPGEGQICKPSVTEFDCKAECAELRDGRLPSGCRWTKGDCPTE